MDELIRKQDALDALMAERKQLLANGQKGAEHILTHHGYNVIDELPTVQPKHGHWDCTDDIYENAECSCCKWDSGEAWSYAWANFNFCPNCGADMRGEAE